MNEKKEKDVLRETDDEARQLAKKLLREARYAALASLDAKTGFPIASRVTLANDVDGTPIILVSDLSSHTAAIRNDARSSLLIGEPKDGDPLAFARMTLTTTASLIERPSEEREKARARFLRRHPKAELYVDFGDFHFFRLDVVSVSLNGGFGKAYALTRGDLILPESAPSNDFSEHEDGIVSHMNEDHLDAVNDYAKAVGAKEENWHMTGIDPEGLDLTSGSKSLRIPFSRTLRDIEEVRPMLITMAKKAREQGA